MKTIDRSLRFTVYLSVLILLVCIAVPAHAIQLGLDFAQRPPELFAGGRGG